MIPALTDDELVALSLISESAWLAPLPTVDVGDADALLTAAPRGVRSLVTRGLMSAAARGTEPVPSPDLLAALEPALTGRLALSTFVARRDLAFVPEGASSAIYAKDDDQALVESVSAGGVHYFSVLPMREAIDAVGSYLASVVDAGLTVHIDDNPPISDGLVLCVAARPSSPALMGVATKGALGLVLVDGDGNVTEADTPETIGEVLGRLLDHPVAKEV